MLLHRLRWPIPSTKTLTRAAPAFFITLVVLLSILQNGVLHLTISSQVETQKPLRLAVIVKTGAATASTRLPSHIIGSRTSRSSTGSLGPSKEVRLPSNATATHDHLAATLQHHFVSDHSTQLGDIEVVDVLADLSRSYKDQTWFRAYEDLHRQLEAGQTPSSEDRRFWRLDKFKFVAMHRYAYERDSSADFHIAIDDDTHVFWPALVHWLMKEDINPNKPHYIGYRRGSMAYGGSGYIMSRALLDATYGSAPTPKHFENRPDVVRAVASRWCGDCALSDVVGNAMGNRLPQQRTTRGSRSFVPSVGELLISRDTWRQEVFTVHHLPGADFMEMRRLEADLEGEAPRYCDIIMRLAPAFLLSAFDKDSSVEDVRAPGWALEDTDFQANMKMCDAACLDRASHDKDHTDGDRCARACDMEERCFAWTLQEESRNCDLFQEQFFVGRPKRGAVSGWHAGRLRKHFTAHTCRTLASHDYHRSRQRVRSRPFRGRQLGSQ